MKRIFCSLLLALLVFSCSACAPQPIGETGQTPSEIAAAVETSQTSLPALRHLTPADTDFSIWLSDYYAVPPESVADGVICYTDDIEASEIVVLLLEDPAAAPDVERALRDYLQMRAGSFDGYAPQQAALARSGIVTAEGRYVALLVCADPSAAQAAFSACLRQPAVRRPAASAAVSASAPEAGSIAPTAAFSYHPEAILQAWRSGEDSALGETDRSILHAAEEVLRQELQDGMSAPEKELAIHDWLTGWSSFDMSAFSRAPGQGSGTPSDIPYGVLLQRSGNCWGYASTFQLFMDLLDIECITVYGLPSSSGVEHAWNMVRLDGEWYCVDAAWDDPIGGQPGHTYFNVTSDFLRRGSIHRWDETAVPEATGTTYAYHNR